MKLLRKGKVRNIYDIGDGRLALEQSNRISAYDVVLTDEEREANVIPYKGEVLTRLSAHFFKVLNDCGVPNHFIGIDPDNKNIMIVKKARVIPVEWILRYYLYGSLYKQFEKGEIELPEGSERLKAGRLSEPVFTPTSKAHEGEHDLPVPYHKGLEEGMETTYKVGEILDKACDAADMILCDFKIELGRHNGDVLVIDEVGTPDACRFWDKKTYAPGDDQDSYDKQILRDYLDNIGWDGSQPVPELPRELIRKLSERYIEIYERLTSQSF
jgi:phosphoribosylaminoimidazole-succinocarboxamide synthase